MNTVKLAIQKSDRILIDAIKLLNDCNIEFDQLNNHSLQSQANNFPIKLFFLRYHEINSYLDNGLVDLAIIGENSLIEDQTTFKLIQRLGFSKCRISLAVPQNSTYNKITDLANKQIATSYPNITRDFFNKHTTEISIKTLSGSVELAPNIGLSDAIVDVVSTGNTLKQNNLKEISTLLKSEAVLVQKNETNYQKQTTIEQLLIRIQSVLKAKKLKSITMNLPDHAIPKIQTILPTLRSISVTPLATSGWNNVHSAIDQESLWPVVNQLKKIGAQDIIVSPLEKMIL